VGRFVPFGGKGKTFIRSYVFVYKQIKEQFFFYGIALLKKIDSNGELCYLLNINVFVSEMLLKEIILV